MSEPDAVRKPRRRRWLKVLLGVALAPVLFHGVVLGLSHMTPPELPAPPGPAQQSSQDPSRRDHGAAYARKRGKITEVRLRGDPVSIGHAHVRLLKDEQVHIERDLHEQFAHFVPLAPARWLIMDMARLRFSDIDEVLSPRHRREIAAQAAAFQPDPFRSMMGTTYQRFVYLHTLYDIMLSFEHSPLVGCTSFVVDPSVTVDGHTLLARNFDFEGPQVLDDRKAVFLMFEEGRIPYASVSWPGFVGAASGMNLEGVAIVIHGARAGEPRSNGEPVAQTVRDLLGQAHRTREALTMLSGRDPMVPHMLAIADASGDAVVVERVPGKPMYVRERSADVLPVTNHFQGSSEKDVKNQKVMASTSTLARRARLDELLRQYRRTVAGGGYRVKPVGQLPPHAAIMRAVGILRDKRGVGSVELPLGDRSAIDALIATHSVVMDTTARHLWVSEGPHAAGRFVQFDLRELLADAYAPAGPPTVVALPADPILSDGSYAEWQAAGAPHSGAE